MVAHKVKQVLKKFLSGRVVAGAILATDSFAAHLVKRLKATPGSGTSFSLLVCPPGAGNIGDAAMVRAFLENRGNENVILVTQSVDAYPFANNVKQASLKKYIRALPGVRFSSAVKFSKLVRDSKEVWVVGADLMDGNYNSIASVSRLSALNVANIFGKHHGILPFSFSPLPTSGALSSMKKISGHSEILVRDPISAKRLRGYGVPVTDSADMVFSTLSTEEISSSIIPTDEGDSFAILNVSGLIASRASGSLVEEYREIVIALRQRGFARIIFLPHVLTASPQSDLNAVSEIYQEVGDTTSDIKISDELTPAQVRYLSGRAGLVVTGRMHLAVMSLGQNTPVITLGTQGKVEGLYRLFSNPDLVVEPSPGFGGKISRIIADLDLDQVSSQIEASMKDVVELANRSWAK